MLRALFEKDKWLKICEVNKFYIKKKKKKSKYEEMPFFFPQKIFFLQNHSQTMFKGKNDNTIINSI